MTDLELGDMRLDPITDGAPAVPANPSMPRMLHALIDAAEFFESDMTEIITRADGEVLVVACCARGPEAEALEFWLRGRRLLAEREERKAERQRRKAEKAERLKAAAK
jgi:hypothetical protein